MCEIWSSDLRTPASSAHADAAADDIGDDDAAADVAGAELLPADAELPDDPHPAASTAAPEITAAMTGTPNLLRYPRILTLCPLRRRGTSPAAGELAAWRGSAAKRRRVG